MVEKLKKALLFILSAPGNLVIFPIKLYRKYVSPYKTSPSCRFSPTCSEYAVLAVKEWGAVCGGALTLWRILRCNPFCRGGEDPVPKNPIKERLRRKKDRTN